MRLMWTYDLTRLLRLQIHADSVRPRQTRRIRETQIDLSWFAAASNNPIDYPPPLPRDMGVQLEDIFIHSWRGNYQAWRCTRVNPEVWTSVAMMDTLIRAGDDRPRQFVITDGGRPSLVVPGSVQRRYAEKARTVKNN